MAAKALPQFAVSLVLALAMVSAALADDGYYEGDGATVYPATTTRVQLSSESVIITLGGQDEAKPGSHRMPWRVDATLHFRNLGEPTSVQMGFPFGPLGGAGVEGTLSDEQRDHLNPHFRTWVDGVEAATVLKRAEPDSALHRLDQEVVYTFPVAFAEGQLRTVRHTYWVGGSGSSIGNSNFTYVLTTGALWAGTIDTALVQVIIPAKAAGKVHAVCPHEHSSRRDGDRIIIEWRWRDLKPDFDLMVDTFPSALDEMSIDELASEETTHRVWDDRTLSRSLLNERPDPCNARWYCNRVLAEYGYPFRSPFVRAQFYEDGRLHEDPAFSEAAMAPRDRYFLDYLTEKVWPRD